MKYTVEHFIKKFSAIDDWNWLTGMFSNYELSRHCALGHCRNNFIDYNGRIVSESTPESTALVGLLPDIVLINDRPFFEKYSQETPKARVLAALNDLKKAQG